MFKFLVVWFLANYSYENFSSTYKSYKQENPIREMSDFIQYQQYREDQLRLKCNLQNYMIEPQQTMYDKVYDYIVESIRFPRLMLSDKSYKHLLHTINYKPVIYMETMNARSFEEFMNLSYNAVNIGKEIVYEGNVYILLQNGNKHMNTFNYANQMHLPEDRKPVWSIKVGNQTLTVSDIKNN